MEFDKRARGAITQNAQALIEYNCLQGDVVRKRLVYLLLSVMLLVALPPQAEAEEPQVMGEAAALIDAQTGMLLYGKDAHKKMYPASTTKVLTALVALEKAKASDVVTIGANPIHAGGTSIWLAEGEKLTLEELLYALMLNSANDAGVAIAEHVSGSVEEFAKISNERAKQLGAKNTHFTNPHGMPNKDHYSTAYDMALIGREAMRNKELRQIVTTVHHEIPRTDPEAQKYLFNHNKLLWSKVFGYQGATGLKTGYTVEAGQCIIASAERDGRELIAVVLRTEGNNLWTDAKILLDYGFNNFQNRQLVYAGKVMTNLPVKYGKTSVNLVASENYFHTFPKQGASDLQINFEPQEEILAPVVKGQILGKVVLKDGERPVAAINLVAAEDVQRDWFAVFKPILSWGLPPFLFLLWLRRRRRLLKIRRQRQARRRQYADYLQKIT